MPGLKQYKTKQILSGLEDIISAQMISTELPEVVLTRETNVETDKAMMALQKEW